MGEPEASDGNKNHRRLSAGDLKRDAVARVGQSLRFRRLHSKLIFTEKH